MIVAWLAPREMLPFRRTFCVHHSTMYQVTVSLESCYLVQKWITVLAVHPEHCNMQALHVAYCNPYLVSPHLHTSFTPPPYLLHPTSIPPFPHLPRFPPSFINFTVSVGLNPFTAMFAEPSLGKRPIKVPNLKLLKLPPPPSPPAQEHVKRFLS